jgi:hypothetical protein
MLALLWVSWCLGLLLLQLYGGLNLNKSGLGWLVGWWQSWMEGTFREERDRENKPRFLLFRLLCFRILYFTSVFPHTFVVFNLCFFFCFLSLFLPTHSYAIIFNDHSHDGL